MGWTPSGLARFFHLSGGRDGFFLAQDVDYCGQAQQGAPLEPALSSAQGADYGPHTEVWHQGWHPGLLYPWLLHFLSLSSLCAPLLCCHLGGSCPCCISSRSQQVEKGRRQGQGARGRSGTLIPFIHFWEGDTWTMHSNGVNPTQELK